MPKKIAIVRCFSFFWLLLALFGTFTAGKVHNAAPELLEKYAADATPEQEKKQANQPSGDTEVRAASFEAVVSAAHFDFSPGFALAFVPAFASAVLLIVRRLPEPDFVISYFRNTFGHFIVINAP